MLKALYKAELRTLLRDRAQLALIVIGPLFFVFVFGSGFRANTKPIKVAVVSTSNDSLSKAFVQTLRHDKAFSVSLVKNEQEARQRFEIGKIDGAIVVPALSEKGTVVLLFDEKSPEKLQRAAAGTQSITQAFNLKLAQAPERVKLSIQGLRVKKKIGGFNFALPTILMFPIVLSTLGTVTARLVNYRQQGLLKRLMVTPLTPRTMVISEILSRMVIAVFQTTLVLAAGTYFYDAKVGVNIVWIYFLSVIATLMFSCIGIALAANQRTAESANGIAGFASTLLIFTTGSFAELFPPVVARVATFFPLAPLISTMRGVILDGSPGFGANRDTYLIAVWLLVPMAIALTRFSFREPLKKAKKPAAPRKGAAEI